MNKMAFISRHDPTQEQQELAAAQGLEIVHVGDMDAFNEPDINLVMIAESYDWVAVVHPALALRLKAISPETTVCIFENANRAPVGEKPTFAAVKLHTF